MTMKKLIVLIAVLSLMSYAFCQDDQNNKSKSNEFGAHLGATTGIGLSYRHWFNKVGFQITALPVKTDNFTFISGGISALFSFKETRYVRAYGYVGNHYLYIEDSRTDALINNNNTTKYDKQYNIGFGPGFSFGSVVNFNLMFGYGLYDILDKFKMFPTGEIGLYFKF
jgi:hypothetical protein